MKIIVAKDYEELSKKAADIIAQEIKTKSNPILGLATGSTPIGTYKELVNLHREEDLDFSKVETFNLDEYYGLDSTHEQSYSYFMKKNLFNNVNINMNNTHIPNGLTEDIEKECKDYDALIEKKGGIDLQLLGIGVNGHIGFNEPGEELSTGTHLVDLETNTIKANSRFFDSIEEVPKKAITMGLASIMKSKRILLLANGENKKEIISKIIDGKVSTNVPASILQVHSNVTIIIDKEIAEYLNIN
ncbi:glucosamine-6-phosphate deaminase [Clostridium sp. D2Q-11]|uniref:Glucosamine-6-phosphate deaminase n=1 Tax=Anaeromonas frigoriresistens TaxID=2683708 RepID=A0A942Z9C4_9FIRM|nr:glucosamine-6-phosphate deaminase [Anaeromonas frigoriresistens]MBS4538730.1 glucosamine-6-phosphate deaminase [Anaeromonas frigoriresistens]